MNEKHNTTQEQLLASYLKPEWIQYQAKMLGMVKRKRVVTATAMLYTLIFGFAQGSRRSLASLHRCLGARCGVYISRSSFYDRFTPELVAVLKATFHHLVALSNKAAKVRNSSTRLDFLSSMTCTSVNG